MGHPEVRGQDRSELQKTAAKSKRVLAHWSEKHSKDPVQAEDRGWEVKSVAAVPGVT
jgi:hypothetical protein